MDTVIALLRKLPLILNHGTISPKMQDAQYPSMLGEFGDPSCPHTRKAEPGSIGGAENTADQ